MADNDLADDLLDGMSAICRYLNIKERQGYDLAEKGRLPLFKLGGTVESLSHWYLLWLGLEAVHDVPHCVQPRFI